MIDGLNIHNTIIQTNPPKVTRIVLHRAFYRTLRTLTSSDKRDDKTQDDKQIMTKYILKVTKRHDYFIAIVQNRTRRSSQERIQHMVFWRRADLVKCSAVTQRTLKQKI